VTGADGADDDFVDFCVDADRLGPEVWLGEGNHVRGVSQGAEGCK
jgi:hypothetical protein